MRIAGMWKLLAVVALTAGAATSAVAQEPGEPATREAAIEKEQAEKAKVVHPYVPGKLEGLLNRADDILNNGVPRWHPFLQSAYYGGGLTIGAGYAHDGNEAKGTKKLRFEIPLPKPGKYEARLAYTPNPNRATNVPVTVEHSGGTASVKVNERKAPDVEKVFVLLGTYEFGAKAVVEVSNADTDGFVVVDAIQLVEK